MRSPRQKNEPMSPVIKTRFSTREHKPTVFICVGVALKMALASIRDLISGAPMDRSLASIYKHRTHRRRVGLIPSISYIRQVALMREVDSFDGALRCFRFEKCTDFKTKKYLNIKNSNLKIAQI
jgi:predicted ATPase